MKTTKTCDQITFVVVDIKRDRVDIDFRPSIRDVMRFLATLKSKVLLVPSRGRCI